MHRSRYSSEAPFSRRDSMSRGYEPVEQNKKVELFVKFRTFRPYLKKRLAKVIKDGRERELKDEVEDIKYYLEVMSDMCADDNHGADALQGFIDRIHEMIRKNPSNDSYDSPHASPDEQEDDDLEVGPPRSPSPTGIIDSDEPTPVPSIPLERGQLGRDFDTLEDIEEQERMGRYNNNRNWRGNWRGNYRGGQSNNSYPRRNSYHRDVDMRNESRFRPTDNSNSNPFGRGSGVNVNSSSQWDSDNGTNRSFGRGTESPGSPRIPEDGMWRDRDDRRGKIYYRNFKFPNGTEADNDPTTWGWSEPYDAIYKTLQQPEAAKAAPPPPIENNSFEQQFERRRTPSGPGFGNSQGGEGPVQIDYNHGSANSGDGYGWNSRTAAGSHMDRDMRDFPPAAPNAYSVYNTDPNNPPNNNNYFANFHHSAVSQPMQNGMGATNHMGGMHAGGLNIPRMGAVPPMQNQHINMHVGGQMGYNNQAMGNNRPGLLPIPYAQNSPNQDFTFRSPGPTFHRMPRPPAPETFRANPTSDPNFTGSGAPTSSMIREMSKQKAQQCFNRPNFTPVNRHPVPTSTNSTAPPVHKPPEPLLATNQMLADPRRHRPNINKPHPPSQHDPRSRNSSNERLNASETARTDDARQGSKRPTETQNNSSHADQRNPGGWEGVAESGDSLDPRIKRRQQLAMAKDKSTPADPRGSQVREDRSRITSPENLQGRNKDVHHTKSSESRGSSSTPAKSPDSRGPSKPREESRAHNSRPGRDEPHSKSKSLSEVVNRVRSNMNAVSPKAGNKQSRLQEIRKQMEKQGFQPLGRNPPKKNTSFDEALNPPVQKSPPRTVSKSPAKSRHPSGEKTTGGKTRHSSGEKTAGGKARRPSGEKTAVGSKGKANEKRSKSASKNKEKPDDAKRSRRPKRDPPFYNSVNLDELLAEKTPDGGTRKYRIPKLKRPEPIPPPREPSPPVVEDSPDEEEPETPLEEENIESPETEVLTSETTQLMKRLVCKSLDPIEAEKLLQNKETMEELFNALKIKIRQMTGEDTITSDSQAEAVVSIPEAVDDEKEEESPIEPGTHRSRSMTRKKSAKRRSSLEKLHDALQEMGFDADLPLGPRKCTRTNVNDSPVASTSQDAESNKSSQITLNKEDFTKILATTRNKNKKAANSEPIIVDIADESMQEEEVEEPAENGDAEPAPGRRGRKRKRKGSKLKPNKKKKGPVTRAQAAVKTALKHQLKDKVPTVSETIEKTTRKRAAQARANKTDGGRVTRSMIGRTSIVANLGLEKIKIESDYIAPKAEPEDEPDEDPFAETGFEHLEPVVDEEAMAREAEAIQMLSEALNDTPDPGDENEENEIHISDSLEYIKPEPESDPEENDTNYETDFFSSPVMPRIDSVYSLNVQTNILDKILSGTQQEEAEEMPEPEVLREGFDNSFEIPKECDEAVHWMVSTVDGYEASLRKQEEPEVKIEPEEMSQGIFEIFGYSTLENQEISFANDPEDDNDVEVDDNLVEPNDFYTFEDDSDVEESETSGLTESEEEGNATLFENREVSAEGTEEDAAIRNNEKNILLNPTPKVLDQDFPVKSHLMPVPRVGDGYQLNILLQSYISPKTLTVPQQQREADEMVKLGPLWNGSRRNTIKSKKAYEEMLRPQKLVHLFKCMATHCPFTTDNKDHFLQHLKQYYEVENFEFDESELEEQNSEEPESSGDPLAVDDPNKKCARFLSHDRSKVIKDWTGCSYCALSYKVPEDLVEHIINQHSQSLFQCTQCFYRAFYQRYVVRHTTQAHPNTIPKVMKCAPSCKSDFVEATAFRIYVYKCALPSCTSTTKRFIFRDDFVNHLQSCSPSQSKYPCHLCDKQLPFEKLLEHYKSHSLFKYHCSYCRFGSEEKEDLDSHFYNLHPNMSGKVFSRVVSQSKAIVPPKPSQAKAKDPLSSNVKAIKVENIGAGESGGNLSKVIKQEIPSGEECKENVNVELPESLDLEQNDKGEFHKPVPDGSFESEMGRKIFLDQDDRINYDEDNKRVTNLEGQNLYRCANNPCIFKAVNVALFRDHITTCIFAPESKQVSCFHCDKRVKAIPNLIEHMKVHGRRKQMCSICPYKTWIHSELARHMKSIHKVHNHKVEKLELEEGEEPDVIIFPKEVACRIITLQTLQENFSQYADRLVFAPDEIDKVPSRHIFQSLAHCSLCSYSTKVRVNIIRHLKLHKQGDIDVPESDPVNPVPCLERKELMFDKMTNWAGSTHAHKPNTTESTENANVPAFVLEQFRYMCSVQNCKQITTDENMLKAHMRTLHSTVEMYRCPHCFKEPTTKKDIRNTVSVEKLGNHLKLHGCKLYRCNYCDFIHNTPTAMEKHLPEQHPEKKPIHYLIRHVDSNGVLVTRSPEEENGAASGKWRCNSCNAKNLFATYEEVRLHCQTNHRVLGQFICGYCKYFTNSDAAMRKHILTSCQGEESIDGQIMIMWIRNEFADNALIEDSFHAPLWRRASHNVKHIRGIFLEEFKEKGQKIESNVKTSSSTGGAPAVKKTPSKLPTAKSTSVGSPTKNNITTPTPMVCPKCNRYKTMNRKDMTIHLYNELGYERYGCPECHLKFVTENSLRGHYRSDHGLIYDEKLCRLQPEDPKVEEYIQSYYARLDEEAESKYDADTEEVTPLVKGEGKELLCKHCFYPCNSYHNLKTHILAKHVASNRYQCSYCNSTFYSHGLGLNHIKKVHPDTEAELITNQEIQDKITPEFWFKEYGIPSKTVPEKVQSTVSSTNNAANDSSSKLEERPQIHQCPNCTFSTTERATIEDHIEEYHGDGNISSPGYDDSNLPGTSTFSTKLDFQGRLSGAKVGELPVPTAKTNRKENTNVYKCFHCFESFFTVRGARSHWRKIHYKNEEERCIYYEFKAFNDSMKMPPGMELVCSHCDYVVSSMIYMQSHHQTHHPDETYRMKRRTRIGTKVYICAQCFHESSKVSELENHNQNHHPGSDFEYTAVDATYVDNPEENTSVGKLIEDVIRFACGLCSSEFNSPQDCKVHHRMFHQGSGPKEPVVKYSRKVLNTKVNVPTEREHPEQLYEERTRFRCPVCKCWFGDKQKMITCHLPQHTQTYICPFNKCKKTFFSYLEAKFHIRFNHADGQASPSLNRGLIEERDKLEAGIYEQVLRMKKPMWPISRRPSTSTRAVPKRKRRPRKNSDPLALDTEDDTSREPPAPIETERREDSDSDVIIEDVILINPPKRGSEAVSPSQMTKKVRNKRVRQEAPEDEASPPAANWSFFDGYEVPTPMNLHEQEMNEEEPEEVIELPQLNVNPLNANGPVTWEYANGFDGISNSANLNWDDWKI